MSHTFDPDYAVPPGETLLETIQHLGIPQQELAEQIGLPNQAVVDIIRGRTNLSPGLASKLEKAIDIPASFWNNAEATYRQRLHQTQGNDQCGY
jgi:HTH-type transcriptional regulator/antitoxin HigA